MKKKLKTVSTEPRPPGSGRAWLHDPRLILALLAAAVLIFYFVPLFDDNASIQWDTVDVHYSCQKYFSDMLHSGTLPLWTPYVFSGMPFLADVQTGAWYPLNWPFFLIGITPRALEWELALHCLLACFGAFLLARELLKSAPAAAAAGLFYGMSGFFAAHSSHLGIFQTAALFPWLLWSGYRAIQGRGWRFIGAAGLIGGCVALCGHFQSALYAFFGLALFVAAHLMVVRGEAWRRAALVLVASGLLTVGCASIQILPGLDLTARSIRSTANFSQRTNSPLVVSTLVTLVSADYLGAVTGQYHGPEDVTQYYFYAGILLLPLACAGLFLPRLRWYALGLLIPSLWYAFGPSGGFYALISMAPGFRSIRAPVHIWFIIAFALALLAGGGVDQLRKRFPQASVAAILILFVYGDLWLWNMDKNTLAYARSSFEQIYGRPYERFLQASAGARQQPMSRLWAPAASPAFGPMNGSLDARTEVTWGYNPLELSRYSDYLAAAAGNPRLLDGLSVTAEYDARGQFVPNARPLPRVYFPPSVSSAASAEAAKARLPALDPAMESIAEELPSTIRQDPHADARITSYEEGVYGVKYTAASESLLRISVPYFPGWRATVDGGPAAVLPVDLALSGVVLPAGTHQLVFSYHSNWFSTGLALSVTAWLVGLACLTPIPRKLYPSSVKFPVLLFALSVSLAMAQTEKRNPFQNDPQAAEAGRGIFRIYCSPCHGIKAEGGRGPDLTRGVYSAGEKDSDLLEVISKGVPGTEMPSFSTSLGDENTWRVIAYLRSATRRDVEKPTGDAAAGEKLFWGKGGCGQCHRVGARGGRMGPDLTRVGRTRSLQYLRQSVVSPNADLTPGYNTVTVVTRDGKKIVGVQRGFDNFSAQLMDARENYYSFLKSDVTSLTREFKSLMPDGYGKLFSASEMNDLVAYLSGLGAKR